MPTLIEACNACLELSGRRCVDAVVWTPLCGRRCVDAVVWTPLCGRRCVDAVVWTPLCGRRCVDAVVWTPIDMAALTPVEEESANSSPRHYSRISVRVDPNVETFGVRNIETCPPGNLRITVPGAKMRQHWVRFPAAPSSVISNVNGAGYGRGR
jgi:hypothetical protein